MSSLVPPPPPPPPPPELEAKNTCFYSRKEKSLGLLCTNFLKLYNKEGVDSIGLDDAANQLGVERRRIYDIVNILESVGVLSRKAKNQYFWKGFGAIPRTLEELKREALQENSFSSSHSANVSGESHLSGGASDSSTDKQGKSSQLTKTDNRKEKSLGLLAQNFVKLFLLSGAELISLDKAATALLGDLHDPTAMRTKVRRLYDIANVFSSMNLIEKTQHPEVRKPAFRWLGMRGTPKAELATAASEPNQSRKRMFGTEITNTLPKKPKGGSSSDCNWMQKEVKQAQMRHNLPKDKHDSIVTEQEAKPSSKGFVFGPFTPASVPKPEGSGSKNIRRGLDLEDLASSYRPQYRNQVLSDLFAHFAGAWKSWYVEAADTKPIR